MTDAITAEPIEMPFGVWTGVSPRNHILSGDPGPLVWDGNIFRPVVKHGERNEHGEGNTRREPKLFGRWQQRCGLSLSLL